METVSELAECRLCRSPLGNEAVVELGPFPKAAQHYPVEAEFAEDRGISLRVHQCRSCGLVQLCSEPVPYYREVITAASLSPRAKAARLDEIRALVERFELRGRSALEIGCGKGHMLEVLEEAGLRARGLEWGEASVVEARLRGRKVTQGYVQSVVLPEKSELFFSFNFLEHQPDLRSFIRSIADHTTDDALGYVTVPNLDYLLASKCLYEFVADHLVYFTETTLRRAFEMNGFEVLESQLINNDNDVLAIVRKRQTLRLGADLEGVQHLAGELNSLVRRYREQGRKVAVWGAGHRTLALLSFARQNQIAFIVDSAEFKQGRYSPVMHSPIVSPEEFERSEVDVVIVAVPGIYPREVLKQIARFSRRLETYVLEDNRLVRYEGGEPVAA